MIKTTLAVLAVSAFAATGTFAANNNIGATVSKDKSITSVAHGSATYTASRAHDPKKAKAIFSNIGVKYPKGLYFCCYGNTISGASSVIAQQNWVAMQFTPSADATVGEVDAAVGYVTGTNLVDVGLYDDASGVPGKKLASGKATGLGVFGACCDLAVLNVKGGVDVKGGTPYWVVVSTDKKGDDTWAAWNFNSTDQIDPVPIAVNQGSGWVAVGSSVPAPSFAVYAQ
ncbi:MAG: hypothetical protein JO056_07980 [Alphaproteobacteria bacterium]|jgi:hypothetical protein|nr:hypothetical protein [Alphaproteobacteria bacterium]